MHVQDVVLKGLCCLVVGALVATGPAYAQQTPAGQSPQAPASQDPSAPTQDEDGTFRLGEIVQVLGTEPGSAGIGASTLSHQQLWMFERNSLEQAVNLIPGVSSTFDSNGRRNESDIFVRGFGRWQVPLLVDGIRIYLPADNRLDFSRFLTADIAAIQVQKGYASVLDGPGAMGGAINLVTVKPTKPFQAEGGISAGGRGVEGWNAFATVGSRQARYYVLGTAAVSDRDSWSLSSNYQPTANSLQPRGERLGSDTSDWRVNVKAGFTPNATNEYVINYTRQAGEKGAPIHVHNNPLVPPNSFWRWPQWDVSSTSLLTTTQLGPSSYLKAKAYYNTFSNVLDAFDDGAYQLQSAQGRFRSPYDDHAYGTSIEFGTTPTPANTLKAAFHYRIDTHKESQTGRPTSDAFRTTEPWQTQTQYTWSVALEDTVRLGPSVDLVGGISFDKYAITRAEEFNTTAGLFEYPKGGSDAINVQGALVWRHAASGEWHASVSDRARFPMIFELYSTRFGTATPNPFLGPERATNVELGWSRTMAGDARVSAAVFYSDVRDLIQTVVLPDSTTQTQNVGNGEFFGVEASFDVPVTATLRAGGNYTGLRRDVADVLQPDLRPTGVPTHRGFVFATWQPVAPLRITPNVEMSGDRWSDVNPVTTAPFIRTGAYTLLNIDATWVLPNGMELSAGGKNLGDDHYELAWGYPQQGRTFYVRTRLLF